MKDAILSASPWFRSWCNNDLKHEIDNSHNLTQKMCTFRIHIYPKFMEQENDIVYTVMNACDHCFSIFVKKTWQFLALL